MSDAPQPQPQPQPKRTRVEFTPDSIWRRQFVSKAFRIFALCATFFGLAMLLVFLTRLSMDVVTWFQKTPPLVQAQNVKAEAARERLKNAEAARAEAEKGLLELMEKAADDAAKEAAPAERDKVRAEVRTLWKREYIPEELANHDKTLPEMRREAAASYRPDTSPTGMLWHFVSSGPAPEGEPQDAGILYGLLGTLYLVLITIVIALPIGVGAAIYLEEYRSTSRLAQFIQVNINNLAGVPSVMFGILGAFIFVDLVFRPVEAEIERPARVAEYRERYDKARAEGKITEETDDPNRILRLVVDPEHTLDRLNAEYAKLVEAGKAPPRPRSETERVRAVLDPTNKLKPYLEKFEVLLKDGTLDKLLEEKKIKSIARSPLDVPEQVLIAENVAPDVRKKELAWLEPLQDADLRANRIANDERLLTPPNFFLRGLANFLRTLGLSVAARNVLGGGLTLALLILPILIVASQEAIRAVPVSLRHGSLALGATQWQTIWKVVLPSALPGIMTGTILAMCRAMGEAAPLVLFGASLYVDQLPTLFSRFTVMPMQIFVWSDRVNENWRLNAAMASAILLVVLLTLNGLAIYLRQRSQGKTRY